VTLTGKFDPTSDLFVAQFARPAGLQPVNMRALTPIKRSLLVIDGTVTKFIEAFTLEPVEVIRLGQAEHALSEPNEWLDTPAGTPVIARHVYLQSKYSQMVHAYAVSLIVPERLPESIQVGLEIESGGIGRILLTSKIENRREILWYGKERDVDLPDELEFLGDGEFLTRAYRVIVEGQPIMLITERFPSRNEYGWAHE
jgi:chorismate-pyruvate lyase